MAATGTRSGYVYILHNGTLPEFVKVGWTSRTAEDRARELSNHAGVMCPYSVAFAYHFADAPAAERAVHRQLDAYRTPDKEFFRVTVPKAVETVLTEAASVEDRRTGLGPLFHRMQSGQAERSLPFTPAPASPWQSFTNAVVEADELLATLGADAADGALPYVLYRLTWELGLSPVRWLAENGMLARTLAAHANWQDVPQATRRDVRSTIERLKKRPADRFFL